MISVIIITKNEEELLTNCLESLKWADEIIVCDNDSTDKTLEIAKKYTNNIIQSKIDNPFEFDFSKVRNKAIEKAHGEWVLFVDADERVLQSLKDEIIDFT